MPRYPTLSSPPGTLRLFDHIGTMAFAASGAALAGTSGLDAYGCVTIGMITALGGGTLRDVVILARRPFWILESEYLVTAAAASLLAFTFWPHKGPEEEGIVQIEMKKIPPSSTISKDWSPWPSAENPFATADFGSSLPMQALDTLGLAAFCVIGAQNGCAAGVGLLPSIICGTLTATGGGMVRDVFCGQPVRVLHNHAEIYATTAMCGATAYSLMRMSKKFGPAACFLVGCGTAFGLRVWSIVEKVKLPKSNNYTEVQLKRRKTTRFARSQTLQRRRTE